MQIYKSNLIYSKDKDTLTTIENGFVGVENGKIEFVEESLRGYDEMSVINYSDYIMIPGLCDLHTHAPQYENIGLGMDKQLLDWLEDITFPTEAKFKDKAYAKKRYEFVVDELINQGTTRVCFFATVHTKSAQILIDIMREKGLKGYVGKVNMDNNCPDYLIEDSEKSVLETLEFYKNNVQNGDIKPIITPRFAPSCTEQTLKKLGDIAKEFDAPIQSHINESENEINWVAELFPRYESYADVYYKNGLLNDKTLMAHCIHMKEDELKMFCDIGVWAIHCPQSNANLSSGIMPIRKWMDRGMKVALGSDVSGGNDFSIIKTMVSAMQMSRIRHYHNNEEGILSLKQAFYLATKGGGEYFGKVGSFEKGYEFDALVIDDKSISLKRDINLEQRLERFVFSGDKDNVLHSFIAGKKVK